jgi:XTP/dITP diphosphohydrolase
VDHRGRGTAGFGYDPLFLIPELGLTTAELSAEQKNAISHRGRAARLMWREMETVLARG